MKIKLTVNDVLRSIQGLQSLNASGSLPIKMAMTISKNMRELELLEKIYAARRDELLKHCSDLDKETGGRKIRPDQIETWDEQTKAIGSEEVEVEIEQVSASAFPEDYNVEPLALVALEWMITE